VSEVHGDGRLEAVSVKRRDSSDVDTVPAAALFIFIGASPRTGWLDGSVASDAQGYLSTGFGPAADGARPAGWNVPRPPFWLETSVPGVFAAGDVRHRSVKRIASAVGEGAMAVQFIHQHLAEG